MSTKNPHMLDFVPTYAKAVGPVRQSWLGLDEVAAAFEVAPERVQHVLHVARTRQGVTAKGELQTQVIEDDLPKVAEALGLPVPA